MDGQNLFTEDDALLLREAQAGDALAFGAWLERHYDFIYRIAWRVTGHQMDAEDLTHDVCLSLPHKLARYSGHGSLKGWLAQVVLNAGRDGFRKKARRRTVDIADVAEPSSSSNQSEALYLNEVLALMEQLPEKSRHALLMAAEGLTTAEIAVALDCKEGTVGWRISTARTELTHLLEGKKHAAARR